MHTAYIFGALGNLGPDCLGFGWSVEDAYAWTVGTSSELALPLPGDDLTYAIRCDISPAVFADAMPRQRLSVYADNVALGEFELTGRTIVDIPLPIELTRGANRVTLRLLHPDAARPCDHGVSGDSRALALCFSSAALVDAEAADTGAAPAAVHGIIAGGMTARWIAEVAARLPSLRGRLVVRFVDLAPADVAWQDPGQPLQFCWLDISAGTQVTRAAIFNRLPNGCTLCTFSTPAIQAFWPFGGQGTRSRPEPPLYDPSRYPYADRHATALAGMKMPDEVLYTMYEMAADRDPIDLDALLAEDVKRWRAHDRRTDLKLADFMESRIGSNRLFIAPDRPGPDLLRAIMDRIIFNVPGFAVADPEALAAELDFLLEGYAGCRRELPVHKRVADHFRLAWWSSGLKYRWENNLRSYREHVLDTIKWTRWLP